MTGMAALWNTSAVDAVIASSVSAFHSGIQLVVAVTSRTKRTAQTGFMEQLYIPNLYTEFFAKMFFRGVWIGHSN